MAAATTTAAAAATASSDEACKDDDALSSSLHSCANDPDFAVICAFLQKFSKLLGLNLPNFKHLQEWLTNNDEVSAPLRDLHMKLLRKTRKTVHEKSWESALSKFCFSYSVQDAWEIERFGYKNSSLKVKLRIFRELLECQFERNTKFRAQLLTHNGNSLRAQPIGRDRLGHSYWLTQDDDCNLRIYQEHLDEEIWQVVATNRDEFVDLIARLRGNEVVLPSKDIGEVDEDTSSSNSCNIPAEKPPPPEEKEDDSLEEEAKVPNIKIKLNAGRGMSIDSPAKIEQDEEDDNNKTRKVKPLLITQGKLASVGSPALSKKRSIDEVEKSSPRSEDILTHQKQRPTLLDAKRVKKPSRYETLKSEDDNCQYSDEQDDSDLDGEEEEDDEEDNEDEMEGEEEDIDSAAAEEDENEEKDIEEYDDDDDDGDDVGEAIEDPPVIVRGQGSGRDCKAGRPSDTIQQEDIFSNDYDFSNENENIVGNVIEEPCMFIYGSGSGVDCLVGNKNDEKPTESNEPKATFFFGEPGCLKLSPIKQTPKQEPKKSIFASLSDEKVEENDEKKDIQKEDDDENKIVVDILAPEKTNGESSNPSKGCVSENDNNSLETKSNELTENKDDDEDDKEEMKEDIANSINNVNKTEATTPAVECKDDDAASILNEETPKEIKTVCSANKEKEVIHDDGDTSNEVKVHEGDKMESKEIENLEEEKPVTSKAMNTKLENITDVISPQPENDIIKIVKVTKDEVQETPQPCNLKENGTTTIEQQEQDASLSALSVEENLMTQQQQQVESSSSECLKPVKECNITVNISTETKQSEPAKEPETITLKKSEIIKPSLETESQKAISLIKSESMEISNKTETSYSKSDEKSNDNKSTINVENNKSNEVPAPKLQAPSTTNLLPPLCLPIKPLPLPLPSALSTSSSPSSSSHISAAKTSTTESHSVSKPCTSATLPNRKRRLTDFAATKPQPPATTNLRHSTSESDTDLHSEQLEELDDDDVGGKRLKMRPKQSNVELRRKVEAQKTQIDETTSSSGEEDLRNRRKIIAPKRKLERTPEKTPNDNLLVEQNKTPKNLLDKSPSEQKAKAARKLSCESTITKNSIQENAKQEQLIIEPETRVADVQILNKPKLEEIAGVLEVSKETKITEDKQQKQQQPVKQDIEQKIAAEKVNDIVEKKPAIVNVSPEINKLTGNTVVPTSNTLTKALPIIHNASVEKPKTFDRPPVTIKHKPTLAEIIEKKLKKTPEKIPATDLIITPIELKSPVLKPPEIKLPQQQKSTETTVFSLPRSADAKDKKSLGTLSFEQNLILEEKATVSNVSDITIKAFVSVAPASKVTPPLTTAGTSPKFMPPKKSPITKPLKKNLLTQIRQEESEEETIPRKRTSSENLTPTTTNLKHNTKPLDMVLPVVPGDGTKKPSKEAVRHTPERQTPERQRKRRNSDDNKTNETPETLSAKKEEGVSEKIKRNEEETVVKDEEEHKPKAINVGNPKANVSVCEKPINISKQAKQEKTPTPEPQTPEPPTPEPQTPERPKQEPPTPERPKQEPPTPERPTPERSTQEPPTPEPAIQTPTVGRRSGRRGGAAVVYSELPQPKRTRGGAKAAAISAEKKDIMMKVEKEEKIEEKKTTKTESKTVVDPPHPQKPVSKSDSKATAKTPPTKAETKKQSQLGATKQEIKDEPKVVGPKPVELPAVVTVTPSKENTKPAAAAVAAASVVVTPAAGIGRGRGPRKNRDVDTTNIIDASDDTPVRQSRRIAQQKIKEEAERRKMEEIALRTMKQELKKKKKAEKETDPTVVEPSGESSSESEIELKKKTKKKCPGKDGWSSGSEEQADTEEEEEEPPHEYSDHGSPLFRSDHEFSPESELEDESQVVPMKRARTARKEDADDDEDDADESCQKCGKSDHPEWILLCDFCDKGYHCSCLSPVLFYIPEGDWYCPPCQQEQLINALENQLKQFDELVALKEAEKRLAELAEREEQIRLEEEKRQEEERKAAKKDKKKGKRRNLSDRSGNSDEDNSDDSDKGSKGSYEDSDESKASKSTNKRAKQQEKSEKSKRRRGDGRTNRKAAKRGTRRRRRGDSESGSGFKSDSDSNSRSDSSSSSSSFSDSDNEPIYKLRKRRQINVSYRLNEYDDLINSALKKEMDEVAGAGNLGRGKDITTIIEADKEEKARQRHIDEGADEESETPNELKDEIAKSEKSNKSSENEKKTKREDNNDDDDENDDDDDDDDIPLKVKTKVSKSPLKKKARKLTTLDISSEEDNVSDEDFKTSSFDEDDTSISASESDSDSSLEIYRRRGRKGSRRGAKKQRKAARRAARERRKDRKFVVEESDSEEEERPKTKKKRKQDSDYTESESDNDDDQTELSENVDSADLCDDTTSDSSDGAWHPSKRKKQRKSNTTSIARKSPKLKKPQIKKPKRVEYSDDDISETEPEEDDDEDDGVMGSGKGSGKQPRSQPLKPSVQTGKGKTKNPSQAKKKKKLPTTDENSASDDSTRRTRGRRYAYLEDFDDDSSDGGIKPGVKRPDTPPEERQKFIQKQEEIKRMLAEKNAEGAKLAATPRLTPIKGTSVIAGASAPDKRAPSKPGDSLSTVPLSVIRQAKVLDIDYLQRKGENVGEMDNDDVESEFDDADFPDDLPEDMDEDAIALMVDEEEFSAAAARELPAPDEVLRPTIKTKSKHEPPSAAPIITEAANKPAVSVIASPQAPITNASGLQEPMRKRLPMPTMHPPLLRHQFPPHHGMPPHHHMLQRQSGAPPMQLLQNALSTPLGQPLNRNAFPPHPGQLGLPHPHHAMQRLPLGIPPGAHGHGLPPAHLMHHAARPPLMPGGPLTSSAQPPTSKPPTHARGRHANPASNESHESKPRGRRKKITPLRDNMQKQQPPIAVQTTSPSPSEKSTEPIASIKTTASSGSSSTTLSIAQPPQLYKPPGPPSPQPSVITRMPHLPPHSGIRPPPHGAAAAMYANVEALHARFYGQPLPPSTTASSVGARSVSQQHSPSNATTGAANQQPSPPRHLLRPQMPPGMSPHNAMRQTYGPPPPLRGAQPHVGGHGSGPPTGGSGVRTPYLHGEHHGPPTMSGVYGAGPPPARHSAAHLNPYRPPIYGNPNFAPRPSAPNMRPGGPPHAVDYVAGPRGYPPYGYYPPPPPLTTPPAHTQPPHTPVHAPVVSSASITVTSAPSSVIVSAPPASTPSPSPTPTPPTNHSVSALTRPIIKSSPPPSPVSIIVPTPSAVSTITSPPSVVKSVITESRKKLITLEAYSTQVTKSPLNVAGESSGSPAGLQSTDAADDSSSAPGSSGAATQHGQASEFSGLVSYFSSQHDDYNT